MELEFTQSLTRLSERHKHGLVPLLNPVNHVFDDHASFLKLYKAFDTDFVYDKTSGLYFVGCKSQSHIEVRSILYAHWTEKSLNMYEAADEYILHGYGMFKSRAGHSIYMSRTFEFPTELRSLARDIHRMNHNIEENF